MGGRLQNGIDDISFETSLSGWILNQSRHPCVILLYLKSFQFESKSREELDSGLRKWRMLLEEFVVGF